MFDDHLVREQALLDFKNIKVVFDDCLNEKQAVLDYKIMYFT